MHSINISKAKRWKKFAKYEIKVRNTVRPDSLETITKKSLRCKGVSVKIRDK
jgi:hypothetical protein